MQNLSVKKGYRLRVSGKPSLNLSSLPDPAQVALLPAKIAHIKPRLLVREGDHVNIGSLLFEDKRNPRLKFLSPGGGTVSRILFGPRRAVEAIIIDRDLKDERQAQFTAVSGETLRHMARGQLVDLILEGGLWWVFRELPFRDMPDPETSPPLILVGLSAKEPFTPSPAVYLKHQEALLAFGLAVLNKLSAGKVMVFADAADQIELGPGREHLTHAVSGNYPSDDPGTVLYHIKKSARENRAWFIAGQDLLMLAALLARGRYPTERIITVAGPHAPVQQHYRVRLGSPLAHIVDPQKVDGDQRWIVGGLLRGYAGSARGFMGLYETALNIIPEGDQAEFLALFKPGFNKPSYSRIFASKLNPKPLTYNGKMYGDRRACIACMHCADVCPVEMLPQMVYKAIKAEELEEYLEQGLLDCVECGLCSYVCPSKIELSQTFIGAKAAYAREASRKE